LDSSVLGSGLKYQVKELSLYSERGRTHREFGAERGVIRHSLSRVPLAAGGEQNVSRWGDGGVRCGLNEDKPSENMCWNKGANHCYLCLAKA
jgi:hypothetical protein